MNKVQKSIILLVSLILYGGITFAQIDKAKTQIDTLKNKLKESVRIDTAKIRKALAVDEKIKTAVNQKIQQSPINKFLKKDSTKTVPAKKIALKDFSVENSTQYVSTVAQSPYPAYQNRLSFAGQLEVFRFPINLELVNNFNPLNNFDLSRHNLFKVDLAKQQFQQLYQGDLERYKKLKDKKFLGQSAQAYIKQGVQRKIKSNMPEEIANNPKAMAYLNNPDNIKELLILDKAEVEAKLKNAFSAAKKQISDKGQEYSAKQKDSLAVLVDEKVKEVTTYIQSVKQELDESGLDARKIELLEKFMTNKLSESDLQTLFISELGNQPSLQGFQKVYAKIQQFQAGNFGETLPGSFLNRDLFLNGVNLAVKTNRGPVSLGVAVNKDIGQPKDLEFNRSTFTSPKLLTFASIPTTNFSFGSGKLSWVGQFDKQFSNTNNLSTSIPKSNMVFTASQIINFNDFGKLTVDISKSSVQYKNLSNGQDQLLLTNISMGNYFRDDLLETMSLGLNHSYESKRNGLTSNIFFAYSGSGFQNPGQQGIANMNMRFGGNIKKNFLKNKVTMYLRSDIKNTPMSAEGNAHWRNYNVQLDSRIRLSRSYTLNLKYIENGINKVGMGSAPVYAGQKIQADFNASYKIRGKPSFTHISLGRQAMDNKAITTPSGSALNLGNQEANQTNFMMVNYAQTVVFNGFSLNANVFYNKQLTANVLLGDMLNSDLACQYTLFRSISMSSGITYLNNDQIAKQVGLRQNVQLMIKKHFDVNAYLDFRKNLIASRYPDLFSKGRAEVSIRYYLDKQ